MQNPHYSSGDLIDRFKTEVTLVNSIQAIHKCFFNLEQDVVKSHHFAPDV